MCHAVAHPPYHCQITNPSQPGQPADHTVGVAGSPVVWLTTVVLGLALRVATGGGFAWSFAVVTLVVLGVFVIYFLGRRHGRKKRTIVEIKRV